MIKKLDYPIPWVPTWDVNDPTKIKEFMDCNRMYFYEYVLGWRPTAPNNHLVFGRAWHVAQEHLLLNGYNEVDNATLLFMNEYRKELPQETDELYSPKTPTNAHKALKEYARHYAADLHEFEVLYTEISGTVLITPEDIIHFRMDSILKEKKPGGKHFSLEHKTGSRLSRQWRDQWALSLQTFIYNHVLFCMYPFEEVKGVNVRGTFFKKRDPASFEEVPAWRTKGQMKNELWNTMQWYNDIKFEFEAFAECSDSDDIMKAFPMNTESCTKYFGCPYHDFCTSWNNPLQRCDEPPLGFKVSHWDPRDIEYRHQIDV